MGRTRCRGSAEINTVFDALLEVRVPDSCDVVASAACHRGIDTVAANREDFPPRCPFDMVPGYLVSIVHTRVVCTRRVVVEIPYKEVGTA